MLARRGLLSGFGNATHTYSTVVKPGSASDIRSLLDNSPRGLIPRGLGRSYGDPAMNAGGHVIDTSLFSKITTTFHGDVTVGAGVSLDRLMREYIPQGMFVPVTPGTRHVTVGGAIACDIHGKNHHVDGSFCDHVAEIEILTPDGNVVFAQPKSDLFRATCGGMGLTGVILSATLSMIPIETSRIVMDSIRTKNLDETMRLMMETDSNYRYSVSWIDTSAKESSIGRGIVMQGNHARLDEYSGDDRLSFEPKSLMRISKHIPVNLVRYSNIRPFNSLWYHRHPRSKQSVVSLESFFHQLDAASEWNYIYGPDGFVQYQFVVPYRSADVVKFVLEEISLRKIPCFLAVLKRFGEVNDNYISFPMSGWTLAVDVPSGIEELPSLLDRFDEIVVSHGGRIYLAKDARMRSEMLASMYVRLPEWREAISYECGFEVMQSDMNRRLNLI